MSDRNEPYVMRLNRRLLLRGAGGALLALPILPSLLTSREAQAQATAPSKCFVHFRTPHGGISTANMWPSDAALTETLPYTHEVRRGPLTASSNGANAVISPVLSANASVLSPALVAKMNILRGLDIPTYMAHNFGGALGYYDADKGTPDEPRATVDQLMAHSPAFYPNVDSVRQRSVTVGKGSGSYGYRTPGVRSSGVSGSAIGGTESSQGLFDTLLAGTVSSDPSPESMRPAVVDRILDSYKRLRNGNRRLSQEDKLRLDQHINAVAELQRRLSTTVAAGCQVPPRSTGDNLKLRPMDGAPEKNVQFFTLINEVLAVAMNCGATRIATFSIDENNQALTFTGRAAQGEDWHNNVAHAASSSASAASLIKDFNQVFFAGVYLDLVNRLDGFSDGMGGSLLDHSLVAWGQESGNVTHFAFSMPVVTAGGASGAIKTGSYCDYRNLGRRLSGDSSTGSESDALWPGLTYNQWLTTALLAMGVPQSEWAETSHPGYGAKVTYQSQYAYFFSNRGFSAADVYSNALWQKSGELLPFLKNS
jgi:hypothetical protein